MTPEEQTTRVEFAIKTMERIELERTLMRYCVNPHPGDDMSNRRKLRPTNPASALIRSQDGARIPGGCDTCNAYQVIRADHYGPNLHSIAIHHDDWCPTYQQMQTGGDAA